MDNQNQQTEQKETNDAQNLSQQQPGPGTGSDSPAVVDNSAGSGSGVADSASAPAAAPVPAPAVPSKGGASKPQNVVQPKVAAAPAPQEQKVILSARAAALFEDLDAYMDAMDPKKAANTKAGATQQARLYRTILHIVNHLQEDFRPAFTTLLKRFHEHGGDGGVFHPLNVFRFFPQVMLGEEDRVTFSALLNMLTKLANPASRKPMLGQINMSATLAGKAITEPGRQRVNAFFGL